MNVIQKNNENPRVEDLKLVNILEEEIYEIIKRFKANENMTTSELRKELKDIIDDKLKIVVTLNTDNFSWNNIAISNNATLSSSMSFNPQSISTRVISSNSLLEDRVNNIEDRIRALEMRDRLR